MTIPRRRRTLPVFLATSLLLVAGVLPAGAADPSIEVTILASQPIAVTQGLPIGYPVIVTNHSTNTVNHVTLSGALSGAAAAEAVYLGAYPAGACSDSQPLCDLGTLASGASSATVVFLFQAPTTPGAITFTATVEGGEGPNDNTSASHQDTWTTDVATNVIPASIDVTHRYVLQGGGSVSTGIDAVVSALNPHGTQVTVPSTAMGVEALVEDRLDGPACPAAIASDCFGQWSYLSIGQGATFPRPGLQVTIRFDYSELPNGMTDKKLRVVQFNDDGTSTPITTLCDSASAPTNAPCYLPAVKQADRDLVITVWLLHNGNIRGW
ncbi:MAG TPA: hypothetical protein VFK93_03755 [Candidatus Limnocylindria bacterium]|jgi:hypothetical protein|nr:hypothetical protein [Candidatus Limnocylindria bacterium]